MPDYKMPAGAFAGKLIGNLLEGADEEGAKLVRDAADEAIKLEGLAETVADQTLDLLVPTLWRVLCGKSSDALAGVEVQLESRM